MDTVSEVKNLKKQVRKLKRTSGNEVQLSRELISNSTSVFNTVSLLMRGLFSEEEIISHSVSGKASNSKTGGKPKFNHAKLQFF